jgi:hypothetical protein
LFAGSKIPGFWFNIYRALFIVILRL